MFDPLLIPLHCEPEAIADLSTGFRGFALAGAEPHWLISGVWLYTDSTTYLATPGVEVLADGTIARVLHVDRPETLLNRLRADLPDVQARVDARGAGIELPPIPAELPPAEPENSWAEGEYRLRIVNRRIERQSVTYRIGCALIFEREPNRQLLVGADPSMLALVASEDPELIGTYLANCEIIAADDYPSTLA